MYKTKSLLNKLNRRVERTKDRISELEDRSIDYIPFEQQRDKLLRGLG